MISFSISSAIIACCFSSFMELKNSFALVTERLHTSSIFFPSTVTLRLSFLSLFPLHSLHGISRIRPSISHFDHSLSVSSYRRCKLVTMPSKVVIYFESPRFPICSISISSLPVPYKIILIISCGKSLTGVLRLKLYFLESPRKTAFAMLPSLSGARQPLTENAPSSTESSSLIRTSDGSTRFKRPIPLHREQAPKGLLNENILGESSSMLIPQSSQA